LILAITEQKPLIHKRFPIKTQRRTIGKVAIRAIVQSHPLHQSRFNNPARWSDAPARIAETKTKNLLEINSLKIKRTKKIKSKMFSENSKTNFYQCDETNCPSICQTETRHQQIRENADNIEYSTEKKSCRKIPQ